MIPPGTGNGVTASLAGVGPAGLVFILFLLCSALFVSCSPQEEKRRPDRSDADIVLVPAAAASGEEGGDLFLEKDIFEALANHPEVAMATFQIFLEPLQADCCASMENLVIVAFDRETDFIVTPWLGPGAPAGLARGEAYFGSRAADFFGVADSVKLFGRTFTRHADLDPSESGLDSAIFIRTDDVDYSFRGVAAQTQPGQVSAIFLRLRESASAKGFAAFLEKRYPAAFPVVRP